MYNYRENWCNYFEFGSKTLNINIFTFELWFSFLSKSLFVGQIKEISERWWYSLIWKQVISFRNTSVPCFMLLIVLIMTLFFIPQALHPDKKLVEFRVSLTNPVSVLLQHNFNHINLRLFHILQCSYRP